MKNIISLFISLSIAALVFAQGGNVKRNILYIGNSYTYVNNLPDMVYQLGLTSGDSLFYDSSAPGGYTFQLHSTDANTISKINSQSWDYVVLQAQSQEPSLDPNTVNTNTLPYALRLDSFINVNNSCTRTVFFETWGRKYGDSQNCGMYPPVCTFSGMQQRLKESYKFFADTCNGIVSPVGEAFKLSRQLDSTINLYQTDFSHPSLEGSYLAACVFYQIFTHKNVLGNSFWGGLPQNTAVFLQNVAYSAFRDSLVVWNIGLHEPWADFTWQETSPLLIQCNNISSGNYSHIWDFGDGFQAFTQNPSHLYAQAMYWPMYHIVYNGCTTDSFNLVNNITGSSSAISELENNSDFSAYFFSSGQIAIQTPKKINYLVVIDASGKKVFDLQNEEITIRGNHSLIISDLNAGTYIVYAKTSDEKSFFRKIVVGN